MAPKYNRKKSAHDTSNSKGGSKTSLYLIIGVIAIVAIIAVAYFAGAFNSNDTADTPPASSPTVAPSQTPASSDTKVLLQTSLGDITIELFDYKPVTTQNFLNLVAAGKYDGTVFHRIMKDFMIQGGVVNEKLTPINDEIGSNNQNSKYTIAMANAGPNTATSSFFINTADNSKIVYQDGTKFDDSYTVFGKVVEGQDVVDAIEKIPVTINSSTGERSQPTQTVTIISATIIT